MDVLVVEDEPLIRTAVSSALLDLGHNVTEAGSGTAAMRQLESRPEISLLLTDFKMPGMSGLDLIEHYRAIRPELKTILMTGYSSQHYEFPENCPVRLIKPFSASDLAAAILLATCWVNEREVDRGAVTFSTMAETS